MLSVILALVLCLAALPCLADDEVIYFDSTIFKTIKDGVEADSEDWMINGEVRSLAAVLLWCDVYLNCENDEYDLVNDFNILGGVIGLCGDILTLGMPAEDGEALIIIMYDLSTDEAAYNIYEGTWDADLVFTLLEDVTDEDMCFSLDAEEVLEALSSLSDALTTE